MSTNKVIKDGGYKETNDPYKFKNGDSTVTVRPGQGIIVDNGGRHNKYGSNTSDSFLSDRIKKG
ncbi:hypothetical protein [Mucilaginibacter ginsenosidivorax]|uniref:Uncharacterized protein n=1 Tax=Mucilaginibacter ginsenosidivorax TaxID=862126 RepID=A0A5B8W5I0_9SPHI|nr:hypothetical protein [Mucilaginibacter ginsenosidivorax]QEC79330.1 hypothetical protein FSB76_26525 [Mucilaginibacter ginsenosidivorax]